MSSAKTAESNRHRRADRPPGAPSAGGPHGRAALPQWAPFLLEGPLAIPLTLAWAAVAAGSLLAAWRHWTVPTAPVVLGFGDLPGTGAFFAIGAAAGAVLAFGLHRLASAFDVGGSRVRAALQWGAAPLLLAWLPVAGVSPGARIWNVYWMTILAGAGGWLGAWVLGALGETRPRWATRRLAWTLLGAAAALTAIGYSATTILGFHQLINSSYTDFGGFHNASWNTWHGRFMWSDHWSGCIWSDHVSCFLTLPALLLFVWEKAELFLVLQAVGLASAAVPVFLFTRRITGRTAFALAAAWAMLASPFLGRVAMYEFHDLSFAVAAIAWLLWACEGAAPTWLFLMLGGLALTVREDLALPVLAVGLWEATVGRRPLRGILLMAMAVAWGVLCVNLIMPSATGGHLLWKTGAGGHLDRYLQFSEDGKTVSYGMILRALLLHPIQSFGPLLEPARTPNYVLLFLPLAFLPLLGWERLWIGAPVFFLHALATWSFQNELDCQYTAPLIPILFFSAASGARRLVGWTSGTRDGEAAKARAWRAITAALIGAALVAHLFTARWQPGLPPPLSAPLPRPSSPQACPYDGRQHLTLLALPWRPSLWQLGDHERMLQDLRDILPPRAGLCVPDNLAPFFTSREIVRSFRRYAGKPDTDLDYILFSLRVPTFMKGADQWTQLQKMLTDPGWEVVWTCQDLLILGRPGRTPESVTQALAALGRRYPERGSQRAGAAEVVRQLGTGAPRQ